MMLLRLSAFPTAQLPPTPPLLFLTSSTALRQLPHTIDMNHGIRRPYMWSRSSVFYQHIAVMQSGIHHTLG
jgi:hypothetical protein